MSLTVSMHVLLSLWVAVVAASAAAAAAAAAVITVIMTGPVPFLA